MYQTLRRRHSLFLLGAAALLMAGHCVYAPDATVNLTSTSQPIAFKGTGNEGDEIQIQAKNLIDPDEWSDMGMACTVPAGGFWTCTRILPQEREKWHGPAFGTGGYWITTRALRNGVHMPTDESDPYTGTISMVCNQPNCPFNL